MHLGILFVEGGSLFLLILFSYNLSYSFSVPLGLHLEDSYCSYSSPALGALSPWLLLQVCCFSTAFLTKYYPASSWTGLLFSDSKNSCNPRPLEQNLPLLLWSHVNSLLWQLGLCCVTLSHGIACRVQSWVGYLQHNDWCGLTAALVDMCMYVHA